MPKSDYLGNQLLDHVLGDGTYTQPGTVYVSLHTADPGEAGTIGEVSGGSYARVAVTNNATNWPNASANVKSNGATITFPSATASWGTISHFALWDAASGGNCLFYGALTTAKAVGSGDTASFGVGDIDVSEE